MRRMGGNTAAARVFSGQGRLRSRSVHIGLAQPIADHQRKPDQLDGHAHRARSTDACRTLEQVEFATAESVG